MLGFALDPAFLNNGRFYVSYVVDRHHPMNFGTANYSPSTNDYYSATHHSNNAVYSARSGACGG
ncbi:MAG: hypothetical protein IPO87_07500 [Flavobacteriales bacterium]|nr:hypothetical protein [Flavobacteriales bacterium]